MDMIFFYNLRFIIILHFFLNSVGVELKYVSPKYFTKN